MPEDIIFDFHNPWVAIIQIALVYVLPRLTGLISDRLTAAGVKIAALGVLTIIGSGLTWLLDIAVAQAWATLDWPEFVNVLVNAGITFFLAQGAYKGIIQPLHQDTRDAASTAIQFLPASSSRIAHEDRHGR